VPHLDRTKQGKTLEFHNNQNMVRLLISSFSTMSALFPTQTTGHHLEAMPVGSRVQVATEALLRIREEVVTSLDRQVTELRHIHRALSSAPAPAVLAETMPRAVVPAPAPAAAAPSFFDNAPRIPTAQFASLATSFQATLPASSAPVHPQRSEVAFATAQSVGVRLSESTLDPMFESATLEELNDALANAFAMVSSRSSY
jgi:hypothetical protein